MCGQACFPCAAPSCARPACRRALCLLCPCGRQLTQGAAHAPTLPASPAPTPALTTPCPVFCLLCTQVPAHTGRARAARRQRVQRARVGDQGGAWGVPAAARRAGGDAEDAVAAGLRPHASCFLWSVRCKKPLHMGAEDVVMQQPEVLAVVQKTLWCGMQHCGRACCSSEGWPESACQRWSCSEGAQCSPCCWPGAGGQTPRAFLL